MQRILRGFIRSRLPAVYCRLCCLSLPITQPHIQESSTYSSSCNIEYRNGQKQLWVFVLHTLIRSCTAAYLLPYGPKINETLDTAQWQGGVGLFKKIFAGVAICSIWPYLNYIGHQVWQSFVHFDLFSIFLCETIGTDSLDPQHT